MVPLSEKVTTLINKRDLRMKVSRKRKTAAKHVGRLKTARGRKRSEEIYIYIYESMSKNEEMEGM